VGASYPGRPQRVGWVAADAAVNERAGLDTSRSKVLGRWIRPRIPPSSHHTLKTLFLRARRLPGVRKKTGAKTHPAVSSSLCWGGPEKLFEWLAQATSAVGSTIAERTGVPQRSTCSGCRRPLRSTNEGKRIRYRYPPTTWDARLPSWVPGTARGDPGHAASFSLPTGGRPKDAPMRSCGCFVQLSGWFLPRETPLAQATSQRSTRKGQPTRFNGGIPPPANLPAPRRLNVETNLRFLPFPDVARLALLRHPGADTARG